LSNNFSRLERTRDLLGGVSDSFCLAKWFQTTLYLQNGYNHSCHHPSPHKIPLDEIKRNYKALHNTQHKKQRMQEMLDGVRPSECEYCWKIEDLGKDYISDRVYKSATTWALPRLGEAIEIGTRDHEPGYLEVSFSNVCNFKCVYCSPEISSLWYKEIREHGGYPTSSRYNDFAYLKQTSRMPYDPNGENPYVDAFWKWWPELWEKLHTLRLTGGEPLLSRDVWKVMDFVIENDKPDLTFCINSNLCVQDDLIDKMIAKLNIIADKVKEVQIFSSGEAQGSHAEYTRYGLDYERWQRNMRKVAEQCPKVLVANMTTVNILSAPTFVPFVEWLLDLREEFNPRHNFNKIQFMVNYLRYPKFLELINLSDSQKNQFESAILKLIEKRGPSWSGPGKLLDIEIDQLRRLIDYMKNTHEPDNVRDTNRRDFVKYVDEVDRRRNLDFKTTFPELMDYYKLCQAT
jgi:pyruvate-formate lyase-activating enzyme